MHAAGIGAVRTKSPLKGLMVHVPYWDVDTWYICGPKFVVHVVLKEETASFSGFLALAENGCRFKSQI